MTKSFFFIVGILGFLPSIYGLTDILRRNFKRQKIPFYWIFIVCVVPLIGIFFYLKLKPWKK
ncbi:MAG: PLDc N-terminal domain-containing protein [Bacteroidetes bacterium]|nr:PLDc N-terminal domain-containing protein [Bacteroidota bacterium]